MVDASREPIPEALLRANIAQTDRDFTGVGSGRYLAERGAYAYLRGVVSRAGLDIRVRCASVTRARAPASALELLSAAQLQRAVVPSALWSRVLRAGQRGRSLEGVVVVPDAFRPADVLGYAFGPAAAPRPLLCVARHTLGYLGDPEPSLFSQGRTLTHELGHALGLDHPWVDTLSDTPCTRGPVALTDPRQRATIGRLACRGARAPMFSNFMDYAADDFVAHFTHQQRARAARFFDVYAARAAGLRAPPPARSPAPPPPPRVPRRATAAKTRVRVRVCGARGAREAMCGRRRERQRDRRGT